MRHPCLESDNHEEGLGLGQDNQGREELGPQRHATQVGKGGVLPATLWTVRQEWC